MRILYAKNSAPYKHQEKKGWPSAVDAIDIHPRIIPWYDEWQVQGRETFGREQK